MKIVGKKVVLRDVEVQDYEVLENLTQDSEIVKVTGGYGKPISRARQINWFRRLPENSGSLRGMIASREEEKTGLGIIQLSHIDDRNKTAEIYIKLIKSARGRGYGQDAVKALVFYAFHELSLDHVYSKVMEDNTVSRRLFERCGFVLEDTHQSRPDREGRRRTVCSYGIRKENTAEKW